jgi:hypothetical protein
MKFINLLTTSMKPTKRNRPTGKDGTRKNPDKKPVVGEYRLSRKASPDNNGFHKDAVEYFERRRKRLQIVATTRTPSGQILDWIPRESQATVGGIAAPPALLSARVARGKRHAESARFELEKHPSARGPEGTVPVLRKDFTKIHVRTSLRDYLSKRRGRRHLSNRSPNGIFAPPPEENGTHRYAESSQRTFNFGGEGHISVYDPYTETSDDFSLMQIGIVNDENNGLVQSAEAGIQEMEDIYGDYIPHLFVYYTTNNYSNDGDNQGGYNQEVDGWVQYDSSVYPGATFANLSTPGGTQFSILIKYQFFQGNWWFRAGDRWIGYYPSGLYEGNRSVFSSLGDHANLIGFWGEVFDSEDVPGPTSTTMGSGFWAEDGWQWAAYQRNLLFQDRSGALHDYNADSTVVDSSNMYDLETHMLSGTSWGSYQWLGGPGAH